MREFLMAAALFVTPVPAWTDTPVTVPQLKNLVSEYTACMGNKAFHYAIAQYPRMAPDSVVELAHVDCDDDWKELRLGYMDVFHTDDMAQIFRKRDDAALISDVIADRKRMGF